MCVPRRVCPSMSASATSAANATITTQSSVRPMCSPPPSDTDDVTFALSLRTSVPATSWITLRRTNARPSAISSSWRTPAPLRRIGRHITNSRPSASAAVVTNANGSASASGKPNADCAKTAMYAPNVRSSPCAKFTSFSTP